MVVVVAVVVVEVAVVAAVAVVVAVADTLTAAMRRGPRARMVSPWAFGMRTGGSAARLLGALPMFQRPTRSTTRQ